MDKSHRRSIIVAFILLLTACAGSEQLGLESVGDASSLLVENFDDGESCYDLEAPPFGALSIENGEFIIEVTDSYKLVWSACEGVRLDDFTLEMDVYDDTSAEGFHFFGLQFRKDPVEGGSNQYYLVRFGLGEGFSPASCAGVATDSAWVDNLTNSPDDDSCWLDLPVRIGPDHWNHIEITANGSELSYKVNNVLIARVNDPQLIQGTIALFAGTHDGDSARVKVDNILITAPND